MIIDSVDLELFSYINAMYDLVHICKLWLDIVNKDTKLSTSDVLLASKRLVEGFDDEEIELAIKQFEEVETSILPEQAIEHLQRLDTMRKYKVLMNLFMLVMLKKIDGGKVERRQLNSLKSLFKEAALPLFFTVLSAIMDQRYKKAQRLLSTHEPSIEFLWFDQTVKGTFEPDLKSYQVRFVIMRIEESYYLLNSESPDLHIYEFSDKEDLTIQECCERFRDAPYEFAAYNVRDLAIYYLDESTFIRLDDQESIIYLDLSIIRTLFDPENTDGLLTMALEPKQDHLLQCPIDKYHIYDLRADSLYCGYRRQEPINKDVNFHISEGELVAIMGPSGSGKTTLLKTMIGQTKILKGELLANQQPLSEKFFHRIGYVPQDDVLIRELSVYDNMYYYYRLHFGKAKDDQEIDQLITNQLRDLGILEIKHNQVYRKGKYTISGGQRKRLNIALELLKDVDMILLDEPTSGLSSLESERIIKELKQITWTNKIVIINIHQPSSSMYKQFDQVMLLNDDGKNIYTDRAQEVLRIFKLIKTEDISLFNDKKASYDDSRYDRMDPELLLEIQANEKNSFWNLFTYLNHFTDR